MRHTLPAKGGVGYVVECEVCLLGKKKIASNELA